MEFNETQTLKLWWLYILLGMETIIISSIIFLDKGGMSLQQLKDNYFLPVFAIILPYGIVYFVNKNSLTLTINENGMSYYYWPFGKRRSLSWTCIDKVHLRKFDVLGEYGGWGMRYKLWFKFNDKAYIFNDKNVGLQLQLHNQKRILFSTSKADELALFLINLKSKYSIGAIETNVGEG
jgi:hypothetical protein